MKKLLAVAALGLPLLASAQANGGFEAGAFLPGWLVNPGSFAANPDAPDVFAYASSAGTVGQAVVVPGGGGDYGAYFSQDGSTQTITNSTVFPADSYNWSYQYYVPANGAGNALNATFNLYVGATLVDTLVVNSSLATDTWLAKSGTTAAGVSGAVIGEWVATGTSKDQSQWGKDLVIDNIAVSAVPEVESFALMVAGLAAVGFLTRRRSRAA